MSLKKYYDKVVLIENVYGDSFIGIVGDYFFPDDNESGLESIVLETSNGSLFEFYEQDISKITIL